MKNTVFSKSLFMDNVKRLRLVGLVFLFICLLFTMLPTLIDVESYRRNIMEVAPVLSAYMYFGPVVLVFTAFSFLFKRSASDLYHALPVTRTCLYLSTTAAVLTWAIGTVVLTVLFGCLLLLLAGAPGSFSLCLTLILTQSVSCMLVTACALIGLSITGTRFSAFVVGGLILFLPTYMVFMCAQTITSSAPMLNPTDMGFLFNFGLNLPAGGFFSGTLPIFSGASRGMAFDAISYTSGIVYTLVLALVYCAVALFLFNRRKSEIAEKSAPSRIMQHVYRSLITVPLLLPLCLNFTKTYNYDREATIVLSIMIVLVYFLYELITTRRWRNLLSALYVLPIVFLVCLGIAFGSVQYGKALMRDIPEASAIESIQVQTSDNSYRGLLTRQIRFDDPDLKQIISESLRYSYDVVTTQSSYNYYLNTSIRIRLNSGGTMSRSLTIMPALQEKFDTLLRNNPQYLQAMRALPADDEVDSVSTLIPESDKKTQAALDAAWAQYLAELRALPPEEYERNQSVPHASPAAPEAPIHHGLDWYEGPFDLNFYFYVTGMHQGEAFSNSYALMSDTPQAAIMIMQLVNQQAQQGRSDLMAYLQNKQSIDWISTSLQLYNVPMDGKKLNSGLCDIQSVNSDTGGRFAGPKGTMESPLMTHENQLKLVDLLLAIDKTPTDLNAPFAQFSISLSTMENERYGQYATPQIYVPLDENTLAQILALFAPANGQGAATTA